MSALHERISLGLLTTGLAIGLSTFACSNDSPAGRDTKDQVSTMSVDKKTIENYEDFNNIVVFCDGTTRIYTTTEFAPVYVTDAVQCGGSGEFTRVIGGYSVGG